ncbi:MAG: hypothetical protein HW416_2774 [Chloroflexi bacterium]|nr:hypothetical protein [Chloroflexota bacterium]
MHHARRPLLIALLGLTLLACASPGQRATEPVGAGANRPASAPERTLIIAIELEPQNISVLVPATPTVSSNHVTRPFNAMLELVDGQGVAHPYLAEALPQLNTSSWRILPDGRMETTYRLRPNVVWHDGAPLTAEDFVFAFQVVTKPEANFAAGSAPPISYIENATASDDRTLTFHWRQLYPDASVLTLGGSRGGLPPFPRHILEAPFREGLGDAFVRHPYWTREFVGLGPYRMDRWDLGVSMEAVAFDRHVLGVPKIQRIRWVFIPDGNAATASIRSGAIQMAADSLDFNQAVELKREWAGNRGGQVIAGYTSTRNILFQFRPEYVSPRAILDARVRRALASAIDRQLFNESLFGGENLLMDSLFLPTFSYFPAIDRSIVKYPFDPRATDRLMNEAGYVKAADGPFTGADGRLTFDFKIGEDNGGVPERAVVAGMWRQAGFDIEEVNMTTAQLRDPETRSTFHAISAYITGAHENNQVSQLQTEQIGSAENRWRGNNRGGWINQEFDRLVLALNNTLDADARVGVRSQIAKLVTDELPLITLASNPSAYAFATGIRGPGPLVLLTTGITWNIADWELS